MGNLIISCFIFLFFGSCVLDHERDAQGLSFQSQKNYSLPLSYVECLESFYWSTENFVSRASLKYSLDTHLIDFAGIYAGESRTAYVSGTSSKFNSKTRHELTEQDIITCEEINKKIMQVSLGYPVGHLMRQYFSYDQIKALKENDIFREIKEEFLIVENYSFEHDIIPGVRNIISKLELQMKVTCEQPWLAKKDPLENSTIIFKAPEGKCNFSLDDYELELLSGKKILISLRGYYEKDHQQPFTSAIIKIISFGFKNVENKI